MTETDSQDHVDRDIKEVDRWRWVRNLRRSLANQARLFWKSKLAVAGLVIIVIYIIMAVTAPAIAPYEPQERVIYDDGSWADSEPPSLSHPLGTTSNAHDVLSQLIHGSRIAMFVGGLGALTVTLIGTSVGVVSGYYGGWVDESAMRLVDLLYGIPFVPFVIVIATVFGPTVWNIIVGIAVIYWLTTARVIRSEVLKIKEQPYIEAARATGATDLRIMGIHILPNVVPLSVLYAAIAVGYSIVAQASIAFLGFGDPTVPSWGVMLQRAFASQEFGDMWWWVIPPGLSITLVVTGAYLIGRGYEEVVNPQLQN